MKRDVRKQEDLLAKISEGVSVVSDSRFVLPVIIIGFGIVISMWLLLLFRTEQTLQFFNFVGRNGLLIRLVFFAVFIVGFLVVSSIVGLIFPATRMEVEDKRVMSGYADQMESNSKWRRWIFAGMVSALNTLLFFLLATGN